MQGRERKRNEKNMAGMKNYIDILMGCLYIFISIYILQMPGMGERFGKDTVYIFAGLFGLYGLYRGVRGLLGLLKKPEERRER